MTRVCSNPVHHNPKPHVLQEHHSPPRSWTTDDGATSTLWPLCGTCHDTAHEILNLYVHAAGKPAKAVLHGYNPFLVRIADEAWARRPSDHPPFTDTAPKEHP